MALIKNFAEDTKFYYATISYLSLNKLTRKSIAINKDPVTMLVHLLVLDSENPDFVEVENRLEYSIPQIKTIRSPNMVSFPKVDQQSGEILIEQAKDPVSGDLLFEEISTNDPENPTETITQPVMVQIMEDIENGFKEEEDTTYIFPFSVENMQVAGNDPFRIGFDWLKENIELFRDYISDETL